MKRKKYKKNEKKHFSLVRRIGKYRAIIAIERILPEKIFIMLEKGGEFIDNINTFTGRKIRTMEERAKEAKRSMRNIEIQKAIKLIKGNGIFYSTKELFSRKSMVLGYYGSWIETKKIIEQSLEKMNVER